MKTRIALFVTLMSVLLLLSACSTESKLIGTWEAYDQEITFYKENRVESNGDYGTWQLLGDNELELDFGVYGIEHYTIVAINSQELVLSSDKALPLTSDEDDLEVTYTRTK